MNKKLKIKYDKVKDDLLALEEDTIQSINSQYEMLAKNTNSDINEVDNLMKALLEESEILDEASEMFSRMAKSTNIAAGEIRTRVKEANRYGNAKLKKKLFKPTKPNALIDYKEEKNDHFAKGNTFYKLFWVFFIGCFAGVIIETVWWYIVTGEIESRKGLIYGPFNLVYGLGALGLNLTLYRYRNRSKFYSFLGGFIVGSILEYGCSYFQEMVFGSTSWDYSNYAFNLNGRICLQFSIIWGFLGIVWIKEVYPRLASLIMKIPNKVGKNLTFVLLVFMILNSLISGLACYRYYERYQGSEASNKLEVILDELYPDSLMKRVYANLEFK